MNAPISTTTPGLTRAAGLLQETHGFTTRGSQAVADTVNVLRVSWTGEAFNIYERSMQAWFQDCKAITDALASMILLVQEHATTATRGEDNNVQLAASIPTGPDLGI
ncbi:WXG100 family type VII secretion target [Saccharothrix longispora]|uniref:WXG100 family type VII secretion target n=1 Tax=Saccharothrix longispora TaxID=33920 RepID=A0ABU1PTL3_9PSEU|nr:hypothetical protein [Saccharothrix longispora]MDR6593454.1 WXG100 family type VII secretion target [Saccharothrix longispora]